MENTENNSPKAKELIADYEKKGKLNNPKEVKNDLAYLAEKPIKNVTKELATYFNSSEKEIKNDASKIGKSETKEREIPGKEAQVLNNDKNQNGIKDNREHDRNNNSIPDKKERDLNQNGIDDKKEGVKLLNKESFEKLNPVEQRKYESKIIDRYNELGQISANPELGKLNSKEQKELKTINDYLPKLESFTTKDIAPTLSKTEIQKRLDDTFSPGQYKAEQIPFKDFKTHLGLNEKQVLDKGKPFLEPLLNGGRTEMQNHKITSVNDMEVKGRLSIKNDKLHIHPFRPELKEGEKVKLKGFQELNFNQKEIAQLNLGNAISKAAVKKDGTKEVLFVQKDKQNNEILGLPQNKLRSPDAIGNKALSIEQKEQISKGKELTLKDPNKGNSTVKIDLTSNKGFSVYNERGMKENKTMDFYKKDFGKSTKENLAFSKERTPKNERTYKPDNQRSRGSNARTR